MSLKRRPPKVYTPADRIVLVTEVQARQRLDSSQSIDTIARQLGITGPTYFNWLRQGVRPAPKETTSRPAAPQREPASSDLRVKAARRYNPERRREVIAEIAHRVADGQSLTAALAAVDLGRTTYRRWLEQAAPVPTFRAVTVAPMPSVATPAVTSVALIAKPEIAPALAPPGLTLTLVAPGGYRIEGLGIESAAALLKALA